MKPCGTQRGGLVAYALLLVLGLVEPCAGAAVRHYVFFGMDRERIAEPAFLETPAFEGAQLKYTWRELEPRKGEYDFSAIRRDLVFLESRGKRLFVQLQDASFDPQRVLVPDYLREEPRYAGGANAQYRLEDEQESEAFVEGWVARRWDPAVRRRFHRLLAALGRQFDGRIAGLNLPETAVEFGGTGRWFPPGFTPEKYRDAVRANLRALRRAFPRSVAMQYANFMPGEWLPENDHGHLRAVYREAWRLGVGVGGPDLLPFRAGQQRHAYPLIRESAGRVPTGIAVQDGNLAERVPGTDRRVTAAMLGDYAERDLRVGFVFWGTEEPFFSSEVIPWLRTVGAPPR